MAEHEDLIFEHELKAKLEQLDAQIKIPEIPDAQSIFDRAEKENNTARVIPFKKYSRYIAAAAAVALICVSIPVIGALSDGEIDMATNETAPEAAPESARDSDMLDYFAEEESPAEAETETVEEPQAIGPQYSSANSSMATVSSSQASDEKDAIVLGDDPYPGENCSLPIEAALRLFFTSAEAEKKDDITAPAVESFTEEINKKRSLEVVIGNGSVSVVVNDEEEGEALSVFWVEGIYQNSYLDKKSGNYVITAVKPVTEEDFESGNFYPMGSDTERGKFMITGGDITVPDKVTEGVITLKIEIDPGTGEYKITGELK